MYGEYLSGHTSLVYNWLLLLLFLAFGGLHDNIKFAIVGCTQWKLFTAVHFSVQCRNQVVSSEGTLLEPREYLNYQDTFVWNNRRATASPLPMVPDKSL